MRRSDKRYARIIAVIGAGIVALTVGAIVTGTTTATAAPGNPKDALQCQTEAWVFTTVTRDDSTKETRSAEELATGWANAVRPQRAAQTQQQQVLFNSADTKAFAFLDSSGLRTAVLTLEKDANLGWHIENIAECAPGGGK